MAASPFMPLYIADYMADTAHLTTVEHGAYLLLIMTYWQRGEALPDDDKKLSRIVGLQGRNWKRVRAEIEPFFDFRDGKWTHHRIERQLQVMRSQSHANSLNGKKGGAATAAKSLKRKPSEAEAKPQRNSSHTEADTDNTLSKDSGADAPSAEKVFWDAAIAYLGEKRRGAIGKWLSQHGREATASAIAQAQINNAMEPVAYINKVLAKAKQADWEFTGPC
jgi:uncharacterized protein YdaU (DUF1376 family)